MRSWVLAALLIGATILAGCTGGGDADGLSSEVETGGWTVTVTYPDRSERRYQVTSDPAKTDTDEDGLSDFRELQMSTDPRSIDTDRDRLLDGTGKCPEAGSDLADRILEANIIEHPEKPGCYVGEAQWEHAGMTIQTKPTDAHSDDSQRIGDGLPDAREIVGWNVTVSGRTYHVVSNPSTNSPDTDRDGLHDGLERQLGTDPRNTDTDDDGVDDYIDAAPLGNLVIVLRLERIDLKEDQQLGGGAQLRMDARLGDESRSAGPASIPSGTSKPGMQLTFDVPDEGATREDEPYGANHWTGQATISFWHDPSSGQDDPIQVKGSGNNGNILELRYRAFEDTWTGDAQGGTSEGPEAKVWIELDARVET